MLDPESATPRHLLRQLPADVRSTWTDQHARSVAVGEIVAALEFDHRQGDLSHAVTELDRIVEAVLTGLGVPRGAIQRPVRLERLPLGRNGLKLPDSRLVLSTTYLRTVQRLYGSVDPVFRTWIHESVHARAPFADDYLAEFEAWPGYEEGLADGMAGAICQAGGMEMRETGYQPYVAAYAALAHALAWDLWTLLRALWTFPVGRVRDGLVPVVHQRRIALISTGVSARFGEQLRATADAMFAPGQATRDVSHSGLVDRWRTALR